MGAPKRVWRDCEHTVPRVEWVFGYLPAQTPLMSMMNIEVNIVQVEMSAQPCLAGPDDTGPASSPP